MDSWPWNIYAQTVVWIYIFLMFFSEIALHGVLNYVKHKYYIQTPAELKAFTIPLWHLGTDEEKKVAIGSLRTKKNSITLASSK